MFDFRECFISSGYILNSPHYIMGGMPRPVFIWGYPDFLKSRFSSRIVVVFRFVGQLLEHPVWRHLQHPAHLFCQFSGKFEKSCSPMNLRDDFIASI